MSEVLYRTRSCIIADGPDRLYVFTSGARNTVNAKGIAQIHAVLDAHLDEIIAENEIPAELSDDVARTVGRYLKVLVEAGALSLSDACNSKSGAALDTEHPDFADLIATRAHNEFSLNGLRVCLTIGHICDQNHTVRPDILVSCLDEECLLSALLTYSKTPPHGSIILLLMDSSQLSSIHRTLSLYIEWLCLLTADKTSSGSQLAVYRMDRDRWGLTRLFATATGEPWDRLGMSDALNLIQPANCEQLPLAVASAKWGSRAKSSTMYGLRYDETFREALLTSLLMNMEPCPRCDEAAAGLLDVLRKGSPGRGPAQSARTHIALLAFLIEQYLESTITPETRAFCDLLTEKSSDPDTIYLQKVLGMREPSAPSVLSCTELGLFAYETNHGRFISLIKEKALRDALLAAVFLSFRPDMAGLAVNSLIAEYAPYADAAQLQEAVDSSAAYLHLSVSDLPFRIERHSLWGLDRWSGVAL
jgi:hypothetical protein